MCDKMKSFLPGEVWRDTDSNPIQAHGGGVLFCDGVYYWYGEHKGGKTTYEPTTGLSRIDVVGVSCYSSKNLYDWKYEGLALPANKTDPEHDLYTKKVVERPKVIYNETTKKYVMWMHVDNEDYSFACAGIAVSDAPTGPFAYVGSIRPNSAESWDMTLFKDSDREAYLIRASCHNSANSFERRSEWDDTLRISELTEDYLNVRDESITLCVNRYREAPAVFTRGGKYYLITSGCTGWNPNEAEYAVADHMMGPWKSMGNPCIGEGSEKTFCSQSTFVLPVGGMEGAYIFLADRWNESDLSDSRYVWLPIRFDGDSISIS